MMRSHPFRRLRRLLALGLIVLSTGTAGCDDPVDTTPVASVEVEAPAPSLALGETLQLTAVLRDAAGKTLAGRKARWSSSDPAVASVHDGLVTGRAPGEVTITAAAGGVEDTVALLVHPAVGRVSIEPDTTLLLVVGNAVRIQPAGPDPRANERARLLAVPRDPSGGVMIGIPVRFTSSDPGVATVSDSGEVRGVAPGSAVITASAGSATGRLHVTVERPYALAFLGTLPGESESRAEGINAAGRVVGIAWTPGGTGSSSAFVWESGRMAPLELPGLEEPVHSFGRVMVNDLGEVGGEVTTTSTHNGYTTRRTQVFLVRADTAIYAPYPDPSARNRLAGMNDRGEMVGSWREYYCTRNCRGGGWIIRDGTFTPLDNFGEMRIEPRAINDAGQVAGGLYRQGYPTESEHPFFWEDGRLTVLPTPDGIGVANDLDERGRVVGRGHVPGEGNRIYLWEGGAARPLGALPGGTLATGKRVNGPGHVVGDSNGKGFPKPVEVLYRDGRVIPIQDLHVEGDWVFEAATGINDRGQIVGWGKHRSTGAVGALLLTPPQ